MKSTAILLGVIALGCSLASAYYWFQSAGVKFPALLTTPMAELDPLITSANDKSASLNKKAAIWTGVASFLATLSSVLSTMA